MVKEAFFLPGTKGGLHDRSWGLAQGLKDNGWTVHSSPGSERGLQTKPGSILVVSLDFPYGSSRWNTGEGIFVLDCPTLPESEEQWELVRSADIVVCASDLLCNEVQKVRSNQVLLLRNASHREEYEVKTDQIPEGSVLMLTAPLGYTDWGAVREAASVGERAIVIVSEGGEGEEPPEDIVSLTKVIYLGSVSSQTIGSIATKCSAGIIPLAVGRATDMYDDPRAYKYWAYELPVVATATTEMAVHPDGHLYTVNNPKQFSGRIAEAIKQDNKWRRNARSKRASQHSWFSQAKELADYIEGEYPKIARKHSSGTRRSKPALHVVVLGDDPLVNRGVVPMLEANGYRVTMYDLLRSELGENYLEDIRKDIKDIGPHIVLAPSFIRPSQPGLEWPKVIKVCKDSRAKFIWWEIEDPLVSERPKHYPNYYQAAAVADLVLTPDPGCLDNYKKRGVKALPFMFAFPEEGWKIYRNSVDKQYTPCDVALVANYYGYHSQRCHQQEMIALVARDFDMRIYGRLWEESPAYSDLHKSGKIMGAIPHNHLPAVMDSAKIVLGAHIIVDSRFQTSMRTYETMGNGSFYLTFNTPSHQALFQQDKDYVGWETTDELRKKIYKYLQDDGRRQEVAAHGAKTVLAAHTYAHRWGIVEEYIKSMGR